MELAVVDRTDRADQRAHVVGVAACRQQLAGISRRQLERLFKQYLGSLPSRYYLELRLKRARQLLRDTNHSIVQVGLMCGFSSGSHFSTAFGALFGNTPREERQRKLAE